MTLCRKSTFKSHFYGCVETQLIQYSAHIIEYSVFIIKLCIHKQIFNPPPSPKTMLRDGNTLFYITKEDIW